jgi:hypothetical protein
MPFVSESELMMASLASYQQFFNPITQIHGSFFSLSIGWITSICLTFSATSLQL